MATNGNHSPATKPFAREDTVPLWRDGKPVRTETTFDIISPLNNEVMYKCSSASEEDAYAAIDAAAKALPEWSKTKPAARRDLFLRAAEELERRKEDMWYYCHHETASDENYFAFDYSDALETLKSCAGLITQVQQGSMPVMAEEGRSCMLVQEPYGVVLAIAPWNAPCILGLRAFLSPLAMGNTVVLKGPEAAPGAYWTLVDIFHKVGLPAGALNTIYHRPEDGAKIINAMVASPAVRKINFTGSTAVGAKIAGLAGSHLKPVLMELGGKAPAIVCEDADLQNAALQCVLGAFIYSGQVCMSTERILVNKKILPDFRDVLKQTADQVFGNGGSLVGAKSVSKVKGLLQDAIKKGAKPLVGDASDEYHGKLATSMRPVILEEIKDTMDLYYTESFGPTVALFAVESDEEAIKIANDTDYGLASAVFTEDLRRGLKIAKQIETGAVHINSMSIHDETTIPHGGAKKSGWGRFNGVEGLKEWARIKTITWKD